MDEGRKVRWVNQQTNKIEMLTSKQRQTFIQTDRQKDLPIDRRAGEPIVGIQTGRQIQR